MAARQDQLERMQKITSHDVASESAQKNVYSAKFNLTDFTTSRFHGDQNYSRNSNGQFGQEGSRHGEVVSGLGTVIHKSFSLKVRPSVFAPMVNGINDESELLDFSTEQALCSMSAQEIINAGFTITLSDKAIVVEASSHLVSPEISINTLLLDFKLLPESVVTSLNEHILNGLQHCNIADHGHITIVADKLQFSQGISGSASAGINKHAKSKTSVGVEIDSLKATLTLSIMNNGEKVAHAEILTACGTAVGNTQDTELAKTSSKLVRTEVAHQSFLRGELKLYSVASASSKSQTDATVPTYSYDMNTSSNETVGFFTPEELSAAKDYFDFQSNLTRKISNDAFSVTGINSMNIAFFLKAQQEKVDLRLATRLLNIAIHADQGYCPMDYYAHAKQRIFESIQQSVDRFNHENSIGIQRLLNRCETSTARSLYHTDNSSASSQYITDKFFTDHPGLRHRADHYLSRHWETALAGSIPDIEPDNYMIDVIRLRASTLALDNGDQRPAELDHLPAVEDSSEAIDGEAMQVKDWLQTQQALANDMQIALADDITTVIAKKNDNPSQDPRSSGQSNTSATKIENVMYATECCRGVGQILGNLGHAFNCPEITKFGTGLASIASIAYGATTLIAGGLTLATGIAAVAAVIGGLCGFANLFDDNDGLAEALEAIMEGLQQISQQVYRLHKDMFDLFEANFKALEFIHKDLKTDLRRNLVEISYRVLRLGIFVKDGFHKQYLASRANRLAIGELSQQQQAIHYTLENVSKELRYGSLLIALEKLKTLDFASTRSVNDELRELFATLHSLETLRKAAPGETDITSIQGAMSSLYAIGLVDQPSKLAHDPLLVLYISRTLLTVLQKYVAKQTQHGQNALLLDHTVTASIAFTKQLDSAAHAVRFIASSENNVVDNLIARYQGKLNTLKNLLNHDKAANIQSLIQKENPGLRVMRTLHQLFIGTKYYVKPELRSHDSDGQHVYLNIGYWPFYDSIHEGIPDYRLLARDFWWHIRHTSAGHSQTSWQKKVDITSIDMNLGTEVMTWWEPSYYISVCDTYAHYSSTLYSMKCEGHSAGRREDYAHHSQFIGSYKMLSRLDKKQEVTLLPIFTRYYEEKAAYLTGKVNELSEIRSVANSSVIETPMLCEQSASCSIADIPRYIISIYDYEKLLSDGSFSAAPEHPILQYPDTMPEMPEWLVIAEKCGHIRVQMVYDIYKKRNRINLALYIDLVSYDLKNKLNKEQYVIQIYNQIVSQLSRSLHIVTDSILSPFNQTAPLLAQYKSHDHEVFALDSKLWELWQTTSIVQSIILDEQSYSCYGDFNGNSHADQLTGTGAYTYRIKPDISKNVPLRHTLEIPSIDYTEELKEACETLLNTQLLGEREYAADGAGKLGKPIKTLIGEMGLLTKLIRIVAGIRSDSEEQLLPLADENTLRAAITDEALLESIISHSIYLPSLLRTDTSMSLVSEFVQAGIQINKVLTSVTSTCHDEFSSATKDSEEALLNRPIEFITTLIVVSRLRAYGLSNIATHIEKNLDTDITDPSSISLDDCVLNQLKEKIVDSMRAFLNTINELFVEIDDAATIIDTPIDETVLDEFKRDLHAIRKQLKPFTKSRMHIDNRQAQTALITWLHSENVLNSGEATSQATDPETPIVWPDYRGFMIPGIYPLEALRPDIPKQSEIAKKNKALISLVNTVRNLLISQPSSVIDKKSPQQAHQSSQGPQPTFGDGNCVFHALFGQWTGDFYYFTHAQILRNYFSDRLTVISSVRELDRHIAETEVMREAQQTASQLFAEYLANLISNPDQRTQTLAPYRQFLHNINWQSLELVINQAQRIKDTARQALQQLIGTDNVTELFRTIHSQAEDSNALLHEQCRDFLAMPTKKESLLEEINTNPLIFAEFITLLRQKAFYISIDMLRIFTHLLNIKAKLHIAGDGELVFNNNGNDVFAWQGEVMPIHILYHSRDVEHFSVYLPVEQQTTMSSSHVIDGNTGSEKNIDLISESSKPALN